MIQRKYKMLLQEKLEQTIVETMKKEDAQTLSVLRLMKNAIQQYAIKKRISIVEDKDVVAILESMIKQHEEAKAIYEKSNNAQRVEDEEFSIHVIQEFMPPPLPSCDDETLYQFIRQIAEEYAFDKKKKGLMIKEIGSLVTNAGFKLDNLQIVTNLDKVLA